MLDMSNNTPGEFGSHLSYLSLTTNVLLAPRGENHSSLHCSVLKRLNMQHLIDELWLSGSRMNTSNNARRMINKHHHRMRM